MAWNWARLWIGRGATAAGSSGGLKRPQNYAQLARAPWLLDTPHMPPKKSGNKAVQVSMDPKLLKRIDSDAETRHTGRSAYITKAILLYMRAKKKMESDEQFRRAFEGHADDMLAEALPIVHA